MTPPPASRHYVVQAQPLREALAVRELRNQGFETFYPQLVRAPRPKRGVWQTPSPVPLFPKYLFVRLDLSEPGWQSINGTRGVVRLMCMDDRPSPVPVSVMDRMVAAGEVIHEELAGLPFSVGESVEFTEGPMLGLRGIVKLCAADRVTLLLNLLGGAREVRCAPRVLRYAGGE